MAVSTDATVRQGTASSDIQQLAYALLARQRQPLTALQQRRTDLSKQSSVLTSLKTRMIALRSELDNLDAQGTLSPFSAKAASSSDTNILTASASATAANAAVSITVQQLAKRATHTSDLLADSGTTISAGGTGTFGFTVTIGGTAYTASVTINPGDTDKAVLDAVAAAITTAVGTKGSASRIQTQTGQSRLSISSADTGTANKIAFTDTDGLLGRLGVYHAVPTAATATTGGYIFEDLGSHELDARVVVDGQTYYRDGNTITDMLSGVTLTLKSTSATAVTLNVAPDTNQALDRIKSFISKYNDVIDYLVQNAGYSSDGKSHGVLALDSTYSSLRLALRQKAATMVQSLGGGVANSLSALGITTGQDGKLSIADEAKVRDAFSQNPTAVAGLFNAADGVASGLYTFVNGYATGAGVITTSQSAITTRLQGLDSQIARMQASLDLKQAKLENQLARSQAMLQNLNQQSMQVQSFIARFGG